MADTGKILSSGSKLGVFNSSSGGVVNTVSTPIVNAKQPGTPPVSYTASTSSAQQQASDFLTGRTSSSSSATYDSSTGTYTSPEGYKMSTTPGGAIKMSGDITILARGTSNGGGWHRASGGSRSAGKGKGGSHVSPVTSTVVQSVDPVVKAKQESLRDKLTQSTGGVYLTPRGQLFSSAKTLKELNKDAPPQTGVPYKNYFYSPPTGFENVYTKGKDFMGEKTFTKVSDIYETTYTPPSKVYRKDLPEGTVLPTGTITTKEGEIKLPSGYSWDTTPQKITVQEPTADVEARAAKIVQEAKQAYTTGKLSYAQAVQEAQIKYEKEQIAQTKRQEKIQNIFKKPYDVPQRLLPKEQKYTGPYFTTELPTGEKVSAFEEVTTNIIDFPIMQTKKVSPALGTFGEIISAPTRYEAKQALGLAEGYYGTFVQLGYTGAGLTLSGAYRQQFAEGVGQTFEAVAKDPFGAAGQAFNMAVTDAVYNPGRFVGQTMAYNKIIGVATKPISNYWQKITTPKILKGSTVKLPGKVSIVTGDKYANIYLKRTTLFKTDTELNQFLRKYSTTFGKKPQVVIQSVKGKFNITEEISKSKFPTIQAIGTFDEFGPQDFLKQNKFFRQLNQKMEAGFGRVPRQLKGSPYTLENVVDEQTLGVLLEKQYLGRGALRGTQRFNVQGYFDVSQGGKFIDRRIVGEFATISGTPKAKLNIAPKEWFVSPKSEVPTIESFKTGLRVAEGGRGKVSGVMLDSKVGVFTQQYGSDLFTGIIRPGKIKDVFDFGKMKANIIIPRQVKSFEKLFTPQVKSVGVVPSAGAITETVTVTKPGSVAVTKIGFNRALGKVSNDVYGLTVATKQLSTVPISFVGTGLYEVQEVDFATQPKYGYSSKTYFDKISMPEQIKTQFKPINVFKPSYDFKLKSYEITKDFTKNYERNQDKINESWKNEIKNIYKQPYKEEFKRETKEEIKQETKQPQKIETKLQYKQLFKVQTPFKYAYEYARPLMKEEILPIKFAYQKTQFSSEKLSRQLGYIPKVKVKGKFVALSGPLPYNLALKRAAEFARRTTARSITVEQKGYTQQKDIASETLFGFRKRKPKSKIKGEPIYIEQSKYAINTYGEKMGLKQAKQKKKGVFG